MSSTAKKITIKQTGSPIRRDKKQGLYLIKSLGLRKIGSERELESSHSVLKLIEKVRHLIEVIS